MPTLNKMLRGGDRRKMRSLQHELKNLQFKDLADLSYFTVGNSREVYQKMGNSHSTSTRTKKDAIFSLRAKVHKVGGAHA